MGGVRILEGTYDGTEPGAVMVDGLNDEWPVGPIFRGPEAVEQIEAFQEWMRREPWLDPAALEESALRSPDIPDPRADATDPRAWPASGLRKLVAYWRARHLDEDGYLVEAKAEG